MYLTFSQPKLKKEWKPRIMKIWNLVKTRPTPDLWLKVFIYRNRKRQGREEFRADYWRGHYRSVMKHGFYDDEWDFIRKHPKIRNVITLKIGEACMDEQIAGLMAHEFCHYLQYRNVVPPKYYRKEAKAKKWAKKRIEKLVLT